MPTIPGQRSGRFCAHCEKDVVDLSRLTERDAIVVASLFADGTLCGRLRFWADGTPRHALEPTAAGRTGRVGAALVVVSATVLGCHGARPAHPDTPARAAAARDLDRDHDGIADKFDLCPDAAEDKDGFEDEDGCPEMDNDRDQIPDSVDKCPNEPETYNGYEDEDGCPDRGGGILVESEVEIRSVVEFERDAAKVLPKTAATLDEVARVVRENPDLGILVVRGYAQKDERAPERLARQRAENVIATLVGKGVSPDRLQIATLVDASPGRRVTFDIAPRACALPGSHQHPLRNGP